MGKTYLIYLAVLGLALSTAATSAFAESPLSFNADVRPILNQHCVACHGGVKQAGGLSFVYGSEAEYVVEPGDPDASLIIERVIATAQDERMPPPDHGPPLRDAEVATLRQWIKDGGKWGEHWSFAAPVLSELPPLIDQDWSRQRIDSFVLSKLQQAGLEPASDASPERWLRRVSLDLIGLPPTLTERKAFLGALRNQQEDAYAAVVDRLLESPSFGERWASVWLDVVRYADSKGLGIDGKRTIWKYRDWVIRAFNSDMPYNEFTIKQIAGDLLPEPTIDDLVATACHRLTQTCEEGGTDDEQFRVEAVIDRINTTMVAWQGLTFGCVQCHSHPYDPIRHEEYYQFMVFFNNTADSDLDAEEPRLSVPLDDSQAKQAVEIDRKLDALRLEEWQEAYSLFSNDRYWSPIADLQASTNNSTQVVVEQVEETSEYQTRGTVAKSTTVILDAALPDSMSTLTALRFTGLPKNLEQARVDSEWGFVISHIKVELHVDGEVPREIKLDSVVADEPNPLLDPQLSLNPKSSSGFGAFSRIHYPRSAVFLLEQPVMLPAKSRVRVSLQQNVFALGAFPLVAHRGRLQVSGSEAFSRWKDSTTRLERAEQIKRLEKERAGIKSVLIPVLQERPQRLARPTHVFQRGNYLSKSEPVLSKTPDFLPPMQSSAPTRLDLARWLVGSENPLTARVAVNRFWAQLFGIGLVETQEDFGASGDPPSHPLLLDDLAARFRTEMNWSVKQLLREITLSSTYRQSAVVTAEKLVADPRNRLLSRGPRNRLPAEAIRDQALAISGLLSEKQFGEPVHPPIPSGVWLPFQGGDKWNTPTKDDPDRYRRTIYTYTKRTIQFPLLASFDAPSREFCSPRRLPSNTPLQALMTLNDATFVEASEAFAKRMSEQSDVPRKQIRFGLLAATGRVPAPEEVRELLRLYESTLDENADGDLAKMTALATVASIILNLDEVLSK